MKSKDEQAETIQAVKQGLLSADRGEGRPMDEVFDELEQAIEAKATELDKHNDASMC